MDSMERDENLFSIASPQSQTTRLTQTLCVNGQSMSVEIDLVLRRPEFSTNSLDVILLVIKHKMWNHDNTEQI